MLSHRICILQSRSSARIATAFARSLTGGPIPINVEHYTSGWNIDDIKDFTKSGKYHVQTYNKISPTVRILFQLHLSCRVLLNVASDPVLILISRTNYYYNYNNRALHFKRHNGTSWHLRWALRSDQHSLSLTSVLIMP